MKRVLLLWSVAIVMAAVFLAWQKKTGPTYPLHGTFTLDEVKIPAELNRSGTIGQDMIVRVSLGDVPDTAPPITGTVVWRRYPTDDPWQTLPMQLNDHVLSAGLPPQPMAGKLEYRVELHSPDAVSVLPSNGRHTVARFKGPVPGLVLIFHVTFLVLGFLFSTAAGLEGLSGGPDLKILSRLCLFFLVVGGLLLGPVVQKYAFDAFWTGWPFGQDWTDNKLAVGALLWLLAVWRSRRAVAGQPKGRWFAVAAMVVIFVIFAIPHSIHGSTYDYATGEHIQRM